MESVLGLAGMFLALVAFRVVLNLFGASARAITQTIMDGGTFKENLNLSVNGLPPLKMRIRDTTLTDDPNSLKLKAVEVMGLIPVDRSRKIAFVTSVIDVTNGNKDSVISMIDTFQEPDTIAFQVVVPVGEISPDQGFVKWVRVGAIFPEILQTPYSGKRQLAVLLRMIDVENPPKIQGGFRLQKDDPTLWIDGQQFEYLVEEKGYKEAVEHREEAQALSIKIAVAVAMADGKLEDSEGVTIKSWIQKVLKGSEQDPEARLKKVYNDAFREAYSAAQAGDLSLSQLTARLQEIGEKKMKYDAIELCFDVMAADGDVDAAEMKVISRVADALNLDLEEMKKLKDQKIIKLNLSDSTEATITEILGIEPDWDAERVRKHLRDEFQKWNNRLTALPDGPERENAQRMLDLIAEARRKSA